VVAMIAGDVGVAVLPETFDAIVVWAVGWEEVEANATEPSQSAAGLATPVDAIVVEDDMDAFSVSIVLSQFLKKLNEEVCVLLGRSHPYDRAVTGIQCPSNVSLLVLSRSDDETLMTVVHPIQPDLRIEMDVDLIFEDSNLVDWKLSN
jgi:hypothetical protein